METYLKPENDGLFMGEVGAWAPEKLHYIKRYLHMFIVSMRSQPWLGINYVDLFSGSGKNRVNKTREVLLGSPLLALTALHPFTRYYFVEENKEAMDALKERCLQSPRASFIKFWNKDSNYAVDEIVAEIKSFDDKRQKGTRPSLNLAFLDPFALELKWDTVKKLASINKMDLIIYYPQMALTREMGNEVRNPSMHTIDDFFGTMEWKTIYKEHVQTHNVHRFLLDLIKNNLKEIGYIRIEENQEDEPLIRNRRRNAPLYRLIFASKHDLGNQFWKKAVTKDVHGQSRLF